MLMKIAFSIALATATLTSFPLATPAHAGCTTVQSDIQREWRFGTAANAHL
jgi:hypothetical protein